MKPQYKLLRERYTTGKDKFIVKANKAHNNKYTYDRVEYVNNKTKVCIICPDHGEFWQRPDNHVNLKQECPACKSAKQSQRQYTGLEGFISKARKVYGDRYDYSDTIYIDSFSPVNIKCREHGEFYQNPGSHLSGRDGCIHCSHTGVSKKEKEVAEFVRTLCPIIESDRRAIYPYELDMYSPSLSKAIEFNGMWWHYDHSNPRCKECGYHAFKSNLCEKSGIKLLHIREDLWDRDKDKIKEVIIKFLNI